MIKMFCDLCGKETARNYITEPLRITHENLTLELKITQQGPLGPRKDEICLDCVMVMMDKAPAASMLPTEIVHVPDSDLPIEELDLTVRCYNLLKREGYKTVWDIQNATREQLLDLRNFRAQEMTELEKKFHALGIFARWLPILPDDGPNYDREA